MKAAGISIRRYFVILLTVFSISNATTVAEESVLKVAAASSLSDVLREINASFTRETKITVELNLGASNALSRQIEAGAPTDVFISADLAKMEALAAKGLIRPETREDQLSNTLVIVVPVDSTVRIQSANDLANSSITKIATGDPRAVPVGMYAKAFFEKAGIWKKLESKIVATENVRAALAAVESGNIDTGIVYKTDAVISKKIKIACEIPPMPDQKVIYPMAVMKDSPQPDLARRYLEFLDTATSKASFEKFGFIVLPEADAAR